MLEPREVAILVRCPLPDRVIGYAREKLASAARHAPVPVLHATVKLDRFRDPAVHRPFLCEGVLDVGGRPVRAHATAGTATEAADLMADRLRTKVHRLARRRGLRRRRQSQPLRRNSTASTSPVTAMSASAPT